MCNHRFTSEQRTLYETIIKQYEHHFSDSISNITKGLIAKAVTGLHSLSDKVELEFRRCLGYEDYFMFSFLKGVHRLMFSIIGSTLVLSLFNKTKETSILEIYELKVNRDYRKYLEEVRSRFYHFQS